MNHKAELRDISRVLSQLKKDALSRARSDLQTDRMSPPPRAYTRPDDFLAVHFFGTFRDILLTLREVEQIFSVKISSIEMICDAATLYFKQQEKLEIVHQSLKL